MSYTVPIFRAMIASPSDTQAIRDGLYERMLAFNYRDAEGYKFAFQPILWELHAPASSGQEPQEILDNLLVNKSDILLGIFYRKFGNPAGGHPSGTVHEIETFNDPDNGRNPSVIFTKDKSKIKAPDREKILDYKGEIQGRGFLTQNFTTIPQAIELGFVSILHQAVQLKAELDRKLQAESDEKLQAELDRKLQEVDSKEKVEVEESATTVTQEELEEKSAANITQEELEEELVTDPSHLPTYSPTSHLPTYNPMSNINRSIAQWSDGLRFPMNKSMQDAFKYANRLASQTAFDSLNETTKNQMQTISRNLGSFAAFDKNWQAKNAVQAAMKAIEIPAPSGFQFSISQTHQPRKWTLENTGSQTVLIETMRISVLSSDDQRRDEALEGYDNIRLETGEAELFDIPNEYLGTADTAEIIFEYRRDSGELKKGKLQIEGE